MRREGSEILTQPDWEERFRLFDLFDGRYQVVEWTAGLAGGGERGMPLSKRKTCVYKLSTSIAEIYLLAHTHGISSLRCDAWRMGGNNKVSYTVVGEKGGLPVTNMVINACPSWITVERSFSTDGSYWHNIQRVNKSIRLSGGQTKARVVVPVGFDLFCPADRSVYPVVQLP